MLKSWKRVVLKQVQARKESSTLVSDSNRPASSRWEELESVNKGARSTTGKRIESSPAAHIRTRRTSWHAEATNMSGASVCKVKGSYDGLGGPRPTSWWDISTVQHVNHWLRSITPSYRRMWFRIRASIPFPNPSFEITTQPMTCDENKAEPV